MKKLFYLNKEGNFWHVLFQCDKKIIQFIGTILSLLLKNIPSYLLFSEGSLVVFLIFIYAWK